MNSKFCILMIVALSYGLVNGDAILPKEMEIKTIPGPQKPTENVIKPLNNAQVPTENRRDPPGGFKDSNNPETYAEVTKLLANGVCEKDDCYYLVKIYHVAKQIVAGVKYSVLGMFRNKAAQYFTMRVEIYHVVWENKTEFHIISKELIQTRY